MLSGKALKWSIKGLRRVVITPVRLCQSETVSTGPTEFGLFFDIDGVITRGRTLLPHSKAAFKLLTDESGRFTVPTIFVTNAGNSMRQRKAKQLSEFLDIQIDPDQVVMSHSPLKMFKQSLNKHMLISGQGPIEEIAANLGFTRCTTMDEFSQCFPQLDTVDHKRRKPAPCAFEKYFPKIEGIILFGEPVRWETSLQLILDVLMTDGRPSEATAKIPYPHLPILACNMDLVWMSEAPMPRFGHGSFMTCLEALYKKITGYQMKYAAQVGKPSEITYHYAERLLQQEARKMSLPRIKRMYCIGDNPAVDIYGANLFNKRIQRQLAKEEAKVDTTATTATASSINEEQVEELMRVTRSSGHSIRPREDPTIRKYPVDRSTGSLLELRGSGSGSNNIGGGVYGSSTGIGNMSAIGGIRGGVTVAGSLAYVVGGGGGIGGFVDTVEDNLTASLDSCESVLVCTGVFDENRVQLTSDHVMDVNLCVPSVSTVHNVLEALHSVMEKERINIPR